MASLYSVSIPHRYAKNHCLSAMRVSVFEFQFLIGTLKTGTDPVHSSDHLQFQFLIGTLKTEVSEEAPSAPR